MRVSVRFIGENGLVFPENINDYLSYSLLSKIHSLFKESSFEGFDYFTFSSFDICERKDDFLLEVVLSSCDEDFIRQLLGFFILGESLIWEGNELVFQGCELLDDPDFTSNCCFTTHAPIFLGDFNNNSNLGDFLSGVLVDRYESFYGLNECGLSIRFFYNADLFKSNCTDSSTCYCNMNFVVEGDFELVRFAWDVGVGFRNCEGFGMLEMVL